MLMLLTLCFLMAASVAHYRGPGQAGVCPLIRKSPLACTECNSNGNCKSDEVCCQAGQYKCCIPKGPITSTVCPGPNDLTEVPDKCVACRNDSVCSNGESCCYARGLTCCIPTGPVQDGVCPLITKSPLACKECNSNSNCKSDEVCCQSGQYKCCIPKGPITSTVCPGPNDLTEVPDKCVSCRNDSVCANGESCCYARGLTCCIPTGHQPLAGDLCNRKPTLTTENLKYLDDVRPDFCPYPIACRTRCDPQPCNSTSCGTGKACCPCTTESGYPLYVGSCITLVY